MRNMSAIDQQLSMLSWFSSDYIGVMAMGLFYGLTLCSFSCLPMLTPYLFANAARQGKVGGGFMPAFNLTAIFIIARIFTYALLGGLAGLLGDILLGWLDSSQAMTIAGVAIIAVSIMIMFSRNKSCKKPQLHKRRPGLAGTSHMVMMGMATSLMPCLPLTAILMLAATRGSVVQGAVFGFLFGFGAAGSPLYYLGGATGWLASKIRSEIPKYAHLLQLFSGVILALFGLRLILS